MSPAQYSSLKKARETRWTSLQDLPVPQPDPQLRGWLEEQGLLTRRLQAVCGERFRLELLDETGPRASATEAIADDGFRREVIMWCDDAPCIYASTSTAESTVTAHPWLRALGTEPLGERLQTHADVQRTRFAFACLEADALSTSALARLPDFHGIPLWARRSAFTIDDHRLWVMEVFLPGLLDCDAQCS